MMPDAVGGGAGPALAPIGLRALVDAGVVHFVGAGGAGMCALAEAVVRAGGRITACDRAPGDATAALESLGVPVWTGHDPSHMDGVAGVVTTAAVPAEHPELRRARELGLPVLKRAEALGSWVSAGRVAAVAGTHGKTTTTAMLTGILEAAGLEPTGFVGGEVPSWGSHFRPGRDDLFVVEADEYDRSFHHLHPDVTVVTNVEADHLDVYGDLAGVREAFRFYLDGIRSRGAAWICADDPGASSLLSGARIVGRSYGLSAGAELRGEEVRVEGDGNRVRIREEGESRGWLRVPMPGVHNVRNALGAAGAARSFGVHWDAIREGVASFGGVRRRFQRLATVDGIDVIDDYAHHPTEVRAAIAAARVRVEHGAEARARVVVLFQPHLYSRTRDFHRDFGAALATADVVWITAIYPAREEPIPGVNAGLIARATRDAGGADVREHDDLSTLAEAVGPTLRRGDLCLTLGAGSIERAGPRLVKLLEGVTNVEGRADA